MVCVPFEISPIFVTALQTTLFITALITTVSSFVCTEWFYYSKYVFLKQQIQFNVKIFGNKRCCKEGLLYFRSITKFLHDSDFNAILSIYLIQFILC